MCVKAAGTDGRRFSKTFYVIPRLFICLCLRVIEYFQRYEPLKQLIRRALQQ